MTAEPDQELMPLEGEVAPPMANGEVVFEAPWQSRVFGMARALCEQGLYDWDEFREQLIARISEWDASGEANGDYEYFDHFLAALTTLLEKKNLCAEDQLAARSAEFAARPHGHDH